MGEVLSTLFSTFTTCACGASAHHCAIAQMQKFADLGPDPDPDPELVPHEQQQYLTSHERKHDLPLHERHQHSTLHDRPAYDGQHVPDLGPLIGATRGLRTTERGQGGREGVEVLSPIALAPSVNSVARAFRGIDADESAPPMSKHVHIPAPAPELVVSPATTAPASPRKAWERDYSASHATDCSEDDGDVEGEQWPSEPARKQARMISQADMSPPLAADGDVSVQLLEETLPPKMRKNWIKQTLRVLNTDEEDGGQRHAERDDEKMDVDAAGEDAVGTLFRFLWGASGILTDWAWEQFEAPIIR